ncbi:MAG: HYC_CC_PP family protein [Flavipsychrobacter sp.]
MKKFVAIPLLILYLFAMTGSSIRTHYCGRHLMSWNFNGHGKDCGKCERETKKKKCCNDKVIAAKVSQEQQHANAFLLNISAHFAVAGNTWAPKMVTSISSPLQHKLPEANAPPGLWQQIPLYKLHARFTYYG